MKKLLTTLAAVALLAGGCKKDKADPVPDLPPETHEGKNTFACRVNGRPWTYGIKPTINPSQIEPLVASLNGGNFFVLGNRQADGEPRSAIKFEFSGLVGVGDYTLYSSDLNNDDASYTDFAAQRAYLPDSVHQNVLTVTHYDPQARIIAGRFQFTGVEYRYRTDTVRVTDGRFDLKF